MSESSNTFINGTLNGKNPQNACEESSIMGRGGEERDAEPHYSPTPTDTFTENIV